MEAKEYFQGEVKRLVEQARAITRAAEDRGQTLNEDERKQVEDLIRQANEMKSRLQEHEDNENLIQSIKDAGRIGEGESSVAPMDEARTVGEAFVRSAGYKGLIARGLRGEWTTGEVEFGAKLTDNQQAGGLPTESITGAGGTLPLQPQIARGILSPPEQKVMVADLFGQGTATQNTLVFLEETSVTPGVLTYPYLTSSAAATTYTSTSEAGPKPAAFIDFTKRSAAREKLATFLPISDEMVEDEPAIASYINSRLSLFVSQAEEQFLVEKLLASGVGTAGFAEVGGVNAFDSVMAGITAVRVEGGMEPDTLVISALDWAKMVVKKDNQSGYYGGGPLTVLNNPWGLRTVVTNAVADGSPIVGAFREGATVWRKGGISVSASNGYMDYFRRNLTAVRAEERLCLTVFRPRAFQTLFLTS